MNLRLAAIVLTGLVVAAAADAPSVSAANSRKYVDTLGDVYCCTRDLASVTVANDDAGMITFTITALGTYEGDDDDDLYIDIDADYDRSTGLDGAEYRIEGQIWRSRIRAVLGRVDGNGNFGELPRARVWASATGDVFRVTLDRHLLADTDRFRFSVTVWEVAQGGAYSDTVPEPGKADFAVRIALARIRPALSAPTSARAGHVFDARLGLRVAGSRTLLASGRVACRASVAGKRLAVLHQGFGGRRAPCKWRIPRWASGEVLRGAIGVFVTRQRSSFVRRTFRSRISSLKWSLV